MRLWDVAARTTTHPVARAGRFRRGPVRLLAAATPGRRDDHRFRIHRPDYAMAREFPGVRMREPARGQHEPGCPGWPSPGGRMCLEELREVLDDLGRQYGRVR